MSTNPTLIEELKRRNIFRVATVYAVASWVILQLSDILFPALGLPEENIRYVLIALTIGFPLIITFAWLFEITPTGLQFTHHVDIRESISHETARRIDFTIIVLLSLALTFFAYEYFNKDEVVVLPEIIEDIEKAEPEELKDTRPSIAVLPFVNMSSDKENEHFSDGLSEELLNVLAQIKGLRVAGRTSSFYFKNRSETLQTIGATLNVNNILEGSVRKSGNKIRITAQLVSADDGFHLWSRTFDREVIDIFAIQDEISREVANAMKVALLTDGIELPESRLTSVPEALDLFLRAKEALYLRKEQTVRQAIDLFRQSSALDPEYAPPLLGLADATMILQNNHSAISIPEATDIAKTALDKAASLGYETSDYWATLGLYHHHLADYDNRHYSQAADAYARSMTLNENNVNAYIWSATLLAEDSIKSNDTEAMKLIEKALLLDPLNRVANGNYQFHLSSTGRDAEAVSNLERLIKVDPDYNTYVRALGLIHFLNARYLDTARLLKRIPRTEFMHAILGYLLLTSLGEEKLLAEFIAAIPRESSATEFMRLIELGFQATEAEVTAEAEMLLLQPDYEGDGRAIVDRLNEIGEFKLARAVLENVSITLKEDVVRVQNRNRRIMSEYLVTLYYTSDTDRAMQIARIILDQNKGVLRTGSRNKGIDDAICYLVLGKTEEAIREIETAYHDGWRNYYRARVDHQPIFKSIVNEPRIKKIKQDIDSFLDEQRPLVLKEMQEAGVFSTAI